MTVEYAEDHIPANPKPPPLACPVAVVLPQSPPTPTTRDELLALCIKAIRAQPKREPAARAHRLDNLALGLERDAQAPGEEEWEAMLDAAQALRVIAAEIRRGG